MLSQATDLSRWRCFHSLRLLADPSLRPNQEQGVNKRLPYRVVGTSSGHIWFFPLERQRAKKEKGNTIASTTLCSLRSVNFFFEYLYGSTGTTPSGNGQGSPGRAIDGPPRAINSQTWSTTHQKLLTTVRSTQNSRGWRRDTPFQRALHRTEYYVRSTGGWQSSSMPTRKMRFTLPVKTGLSDDRSLIPRYDLIN